MTLKDLLTNNADFLEKLSDDELKSVLEPYFIVTRPDETKRQLTTHSKSAKIGVEKKKKVKDLEEKLKLLGI